MPARFLPNSDVSRTSALDELYNKGSGMSAAQRLFSQEEWDTLLPLRAQWKTATNRAASALASQAKLTGTAEEEGTTLEMFISHFFQVFNLGVKRHKYSASERALFKLDVISADLPPVLSHADRLTWAQNIIDGEAARQTAAQTAGTVFQPMANPDAAEVAAALAAYEATHGAASRKKNEYNLAQQAVEALRPAVDALILSAWDTIEFNLRHETRPRLRRRAREYGVVYITRPGETPDPEPAPAPAAAPEPPPPKT